jgi:hypothetical protein
MKANRIRLDKIGKCRCIYETSSLGVKYLIRTCKQHENSFYPNLINAMSRAQEDIIIRKL